MSVEQACYCDDLPAHSHVYRPVIDHARRRVTMELDPYDVRPWVDWREVARQLAMPSAPCTVNRA